MLIPEKCMKCELSLETIDGCKDCLRVKAGLSKEKTFEEYKSWLKEQIERKHDESENLPGDLRDIRDLGRMDSLRWVLSLLEENKK